MNKKVLVAGILVLICFAMNGARFAHSGNLSLRELNAQYEEKRAQGYNLSEANGLRRNAQRANDRGDYKAARRYLTQAFEALERAKMPDTKTGKRKIEKSAAEIKKAAVSQKAKEKSEKRLPFSYKAGPDPFEMAREYKLASEEIEAPEIQVTGVIKTKDDIAAVVRLNIGNYVGTVILEEGQKVTMPNPRTSEGNKWISYFIVREITEKGIVIVLENKREAYLPVLAQD